MVRLATIVFFFATLASQLFALDARPRIVDSSPTMLASGPAVRIVYDNGSVEVRGLRDLCDNCRPYATATLLSSQAGNSLYLNPIGWAAGPNWREGSCTVDGQGKCVTSFLVTCTGFGVYRLAVRDAPEGSVLGDPVDCPISSMPVGGTDPHGVLMINLPIDAHCNTLHTTVVTVTAIDTVKGRSGTWTLALTSGCNPCGGTFSPFFD